MPTGYPFQFQVTVPATPTTDMPRTRWVDAWASKAAIMKLHGLLAEKQTMRNALAIVTPSLRRYAAAKYRREVPPRGKPVIVRVPDLLD